jgi:hypothetical protein
MIIHARQKRKTVFAFDVAFTFFLLLPPTRIRDNYFACFLFFG